MPKTAVLKKLYVFYIDVYILKTASFWLMGVDSARVDSITVWCRMLQIYTLCYTTMTQIERINGLPLIEDYDYREKEEQHNRIE